LRLITGHCGLLFMANLDMAIVIVTAAMAASFSVDAVT
jgi:hypothetical protein